MPPRPILPQRRPTNAIPILAPPDRAGGKHQHHQQQHHQQQHHHRKTDGGDADDNAQADKVAATAATIGSPENIDHILDNMFVQRAPYQPPNAQLPQQQQRGKIDDAGTTQASADGLKTDAGIVA